MTAQLRTQANSTTTENKLGFWDKQHWYMKLLLLSVGLLGLVITKTIQELSASLEHQFGMRGRYPKRRRRT